MTAINIDDEMDYNKYCTGFYIRIPCVSGKIDNIIGFYIRDVFKNDIK